MIEDEMIHNTKGKDQNNKISFHPSEEDIKRKEKKEP